MPNKRPDPRPAPSPSAPSQSPANPPKAEPFDLDAFLADNKPKISYRTGVPPQKKDD